MLLDAFDWGVDSLISLGCGLIHGVVSLVAYYFSKKGEKSLSLKEAKKRDQDAIWQDISNQIHNLSKMSKIVTAKRIEEEANNGLIIYCGLFGKKSSIETVKSNISHYQQIVKTLYYKNDMELIDVTIPLQFYVENSKLKLVGKIKRDTIGFCNPMLTDEMPYLLI